MPAIHRIDSDDDDEAFQNGTAAEEADGPRVKRTRLTAAEKGKGKASAIHDDEEEDLIDDQAGEDEELDETEEVAGGKKGSKATFSWEEEYTRSWDALTEDVHGSLEGAVAAFLTSNKRRRIQRDTAAIQRGIIRHLFLVIDLSEAMNDKDMRPSRLEITLKYAQEFVGEFFDQNPISQLGIIVTRDGMAERISQLGGNPVEHLKALQNKRKLLASGEPSLQNALNMARSGLAYVILAVR